MRAPHSCQCHEHDAYKKHPHGHVYPHSQHSLHKGTILINNINNKTESTISFFYLGVRE